MEIIMVALTSIWVAITAGLGAIFALRDEPSSETTTPQLLRAEPRGFPYSRRNCLFSAAERSFYEILQRLTPEHTVFAKVRLAELVHVQGTVSRQMHLNRLDRKHIDFVVCDKNLAPVFAIELDGTSHQQADSRTRDEFVDEVLAAAALPVIHVRARHAYVMDEIHRLLLPYLRIGTLTL
jgi:very-short-patch-repair endonuclease